MASMDKIALLELIRKIGLEDGDIDFLREGLKVLAEAVMDAEVSQLIGAERFERSTERKNYRNGYRRREWDTRVGTIELQIPKLRKGSYFPGLLEPRRRAEKALLNVVQEAYVHGVSTRKVDELVESLGIGGISKSEVSRICKELDEVVHAFKSRPLEGEFPYVWLDATFPKVREGGRVQSMAFVIAVGVKATGEREVLGFDLGTSEDGSFWLTFLRSLVARGLRGVKLAISDAHEGLRAAIETTLVGATWQRCRVHVMRNVLSQVPKSSQAMVSSIVRTIFAQPTQESAKEQLAVVVQQLIESVSEGDGCVAESGGGRTGVHGISERALASDLLNQSTRATESRNSPSYRRRWDLPKPGLCDPARGNHSPRATR